MMPRTLTQARLKEFLTYDPDTGLFTRNIRVCNQPAGAVIAGTPNDVGYLRIQIDRRLYRCHWLAWLYMTGEWPKEFIDHKDTNKGNNKWENLREATKSQNQANTPTMATNTSGLKGAHRYRAGDRCGKPWQSTITKNKKLFFLGHFETAEEAHAAYVVAAEKLFGEFARAA